MPSPRKQRSPEDSGVTPAELWKLAVEDTRVAAAEAVGMDEVSYEGEQAAYSIPGTSWREKHFSSIDRANYLAYLKIFKPWVKSWTAHGDKMAVVPRSSLVMMPEKRWEELVEAIEGVRDDYPLLSDDIHSDLESTLQDEAWEEYERKRFQEHLKEHLEPYYENAFDRHGNSIWEMVDNLLDDSTAIDDIFYELMHAGPGGEWEENSGCVEKHLEFLTLDHIKGGGFQDRQKYPATSLFRHLRRLGFPSGYRTLCWNCNGSLGVRGYCPHEVESALVLPGS